jgi:hypothetical protein
MAGKILAVRTFSEWYDTELDDFQRGLANYVIGLLRANPYTLDHPYSSQVEGRIRELRVLNVRNPLRIFYALDRERDVVLLTGGNKRGLTGNPAARWVKEFAARALTLFNDHLMDPRYAIAFVARGAATAGEEPPEPKKEKQKKPGKYGGGFSMEDAASERRDRIAEERRQRMLAPTYARQQHDAPQLSQAAMDKLIRAGYPRNQLLTLSSPDGYLDPRFPDHEARIEMMVQRALKLRGK